MSLAGADTCRSLDILHVDDEPAFGDLVKTFLEREDEAFNVTTVTAASDALTRVRANSFDCIVSDYDMPEMDGLELLEGVRGPFPDIPFILFTGKGNEEIASEAISRGVTDYLQKDGATEQYEVLANRIRNSVERFRTEHELERSRKFLDRVLNLSPAAVVVLDGTGDIIRANELAEETLGLSKSEITDRSFNDADWDIIDADGNLIPDNALPFTQVLERGEPIFDVEHGIRHPDGDTTWLSINAAPLWDDAESIEYVVAVLSNESAELSHQRRQEATIRQLEGLGRVLSHDLGNILNIARGRLELAWDTGDESHFQAADESLTRAEEILTELTTAIEAGTVVDDVEPIDVGTVFSDAWETQEATGATHEIDANLRIHADKTALQRVFENLIRNAVEHGAETATIRVGALPDGFYVEDDGPGIPADDREEVFEPGYTTNATGRGIGLASVQQIALAHGWDVNITEATEGGARFEFTGVESARQ